MFMVASAVGKSKTVSLKVGRGFLTLDLVKKKLDLNTQVRENGTESYLSDIAPLT